MSISLKLGFTHSAFTFAYESLVARSSISQADVPPGALIAFLQKGLEYVAVEEHINEVRLNHLFFILDICLIICVKFDRTELLENLMIISRYYLHIYAMP